MKYIFGNWKMNGFTEAAALSRSLASKPIPPSATVAIFPPFVSLQTAAKELSGSKIKLGAQDVSAEKSGAFTGDISAEMLKNLGCDYVIVGHSERRALHGESDALVKSKATAAIAAGLKPVICVGESIKERDSGKYLEVITRQIKDSVPSVNSDSYIIAYEPIWAIGSGKTPSCAQITEVHKTIASLLYRDTRAAILYGGSVKASNASEILKSDGVDGVLVGGASLSADEFGKIIEAGN